MDESTRARRPGGRSARVRAVVHRAAVELVAERGADRVTIPAVAERAGVSASTLYRRWGGLGALLADVAERAADSAPDLVGALRADLAEQAAWTLSDLARPGGIAFFRAEVAPDVDERHAALRECLRRATARFQAVLDAAGARGEAAPSLERVLDRVVAPLHFRVVFSIAGTTEEYARALAHELLDGTR
ncbi:TetR/AcrR family transcriptional regulator [Actinosynnema sp.]|uniref:TetR/AcrR family transcriptional regulator n=1 Tax=Actinosynnema sp. TaxID=1872144 RepID=UPI003F85C043